jgi:hypothetical protein
LNVFDAGNGHHVAAGDHIGFVAFQSAKREEAGEARGLERSGKFADADFGAAAQGAVEDAGDGQTAEEVAVVEIGHLDLEHAFGIAGGLGDSGNNRFKQRQ